MASLMDKEESERSDCVTGQCLCGLVHIEIDFPARWAWHDHTRASRIAHGAAYATYVGSWRKRFRVTEGAGEITRHEDKTTGAARSFCRRCGAPLFYERARRIWSIFRVRCSIIGLAESRVIMSESTNCANGPTPASRSFRSRVFPGLFGNARRRDGVDR
jgi:hypothetical protein